MGRSGYGSGKFRAFEQKNSVTGVLSNIAGKESSNDTYKTKHTTISKKLLNSTTTYEQDSQSNLNILIYNVAGLNNKDIELYNFINSFEIFVLLETHVEERYMHSFDNYFLSYNIFWKSSERVSNRGRSKGGYLFGIKKELENKVSFYSHCGYELVSLKVSNETYYLWPVYLNCTDWTHDFYRLYDALSEFMALNKLLLVGDLNARTGSEQSTNIYDSVRTSKDMILNSNGKKLLELCNDFQLEILNGNIEGDFEGNFTYIRSEGCSVIDYALSGYNVKTLVQKLEVRSELYSDHFPLAVQLVFQNNFSNTTNQLLPKFRWKHYELLLYWEKISHLLASLDVFTLSTIDNLITIIANNNNNTVNQNQLKNGWFDEECRQLRQKSFQYLQLFRKFSTSIFRTKETCARKKDLKLQQSITKLNNIRNSKDFWRIAREINGISSSRKIHADITALKNHFCDITSVDVGNRFLVSYAEPEICDEYLDSDFRMDELDKVLAKSKNNKAAGINRIPVEFYKYSPPIFKEKFLEVCSKVYSEGNFEEEYLRAIICPILKKGDRSNPENYRGISLLNSSLKIFTGLLLHRLTDWVDSKDILSESQCGFRAGYSTIDQVFALYNVARIFKERGKKLYSFFIDFKAAFDKISREALFYKLYSIGISSKFVRIIRKLYSQTSASVWNGEQLSNAFFTQEGVKQGCNLSPLLFSIFINDISDNMPTGVQINDIHLKALMFADDIVLLADSPRKMQRMIKCLEEYCDMWKLQINLDKSKMLIFRNNRGRYARDEKWYFKNVEISKVSKYKYLGIWFSASLKWSPHLVTKASEAKAALSSSWSNIIERKTIDLSVKRKVFESISLAILFYGAQVWGVQQFEEVEMVQRYFYKRIYKLPRSTPNYFLKTELGLPNLYLTTFKLHVSYICKVLGMNENRIPRKLAVYAFNNNRLWFSDWNNIANRLGINLNLSLNNLTCWRKSLYNIINLLHQESLLLAAVEAQSSASRRIYANLAHNIHLTPYNFSNIKVINQSLILRARLEILNLNFQPHRLDLPHLCSLCNARENENIVHFLGKCSILKEIRRIHFGKNELSNEECIDFLNGQNWISLINYIKESLHYRSRIMNENF